MLNAFRSSGRKKGTNIVVWLLLGLLVIGLTGFGLGGAVSGLATQNVARVGDEKVERVDFVRAMFNQINSLQQRTGQSLTMSQAQEYGLDQQVLSQLIGFAALDGAAKDFGISAGDELVRDQLLNIPAFQGVTGDFDKLAYEAYLDRQGMSPKEYEEQIREGVARSMLQAIIVDGTDMPDTMARTIMEFIGEKRGFSHVVITPDELTEEVATPGDDVLQAHYDENPDAYTLPETRQITYAALTADAMAAEIEVSEDDLSAEYEAREDEFNTPERRILDVIAFPTTEDAEAAKARLDAGEIEFVALAEERGLSEADISIGLQEPTDLAAGAREAVFGSDQIGVVGPVASDLGPALYRVNAVIAARTQSFEDVREQLRAEVASELASDEIANRIDEVQDLLASGATLEEIAEETDLSLGTVGITETPGQGIAADAAFRAEALDAGVGDAPALIDLEDGGIAALRVEEVIPPTLQAFADVRESVLADWTAAERQRRLVGRAEELQAQLNEGRTLDAVAATADLPVTRQDPVERSGSLPAGTPASLLAEVFTLEQGGSSVLSEPSGVYLVQLDTIQSFDPEDEDQSDLLARVDSQMDNALASDLYLGYAQMLTNRADVTVNQQLIANTLAQYP